MIRGFADMSKKLKFALGLLVLGAGFFLYRTVSFLVPDGVVTTVEKRVGTAPLTAAISEKLIDSDRDGLSDLREVEFDTAIYKKDTDDDGYLDGEEVLSGFNPTIKGDDNLKKPKNLTELYKTTLVAGIAAGDLNPRNGKGSAYQQGMEMISLAIVAEAQNILDSDPEAEQIIVVPTSEESLKDYTAFFATAIKDPEFLSRYGKVAPDIERALMEFDTGNPSEAKKILQGYERFYEQRMIELTQTPVPAVFADMHKATAMRLSKISNAFGALSHSEQDVLLRDTALRQIAHNFDAMRNDILAQIGEYSSHQ